MRARELARKNDKSRRQLAKAEKSKRSEEQRRKLMGTLAKIAKIVSEPLFVELVHRVGVKSVPEFLIAQKNQNRGFKTPSNDNHVANVMLDFTVSWKFLCPLLSHESITNYLDLEFPGFITEVKDAFIAAVMHGPLFDDGDVKSSEKQRTR